MGAAYIKYAFWYALWSSKPAFRTFRAEKYAEIARDPNLIHCRIMTEKNFPIFWEKKICQTL